MSRYLIDSDAFLALRSLGLVQPLCGALAPLEPLLMMGYPARNELNALQREVDALVAAGRLDIKEFKAKSADGVRFKLLRKAGVDKGEAEAIAWLLESCDRKARPLFVSVDAGARRHAAANGVIALDVMGAIVEWVECGLLNRDATKKAVEVWDDKGQERGRPSDYGGFDQTYAKRLAARANRVSTTGTDKVPAQMSTVDLLNALGVKDSAMADLDGKLKTLLNQLVSVGENASEWVARLDGPTRELLKQLARTHVPDASAGGSLEWLTAAPVSRTSPDTDQPDERIAVLEAQVSDIIERLKDSAERSITEAFPPT